MVMRVHENLSFLPQYSYCIPIDLKIQDSFQYPSDSFHNSNHQIHMPGGRVEKKGKGHIVFFLDILDGHKAFSDISLGGPWPHLASRNIGKYTLLRGQ